MHSATIKKRDGQFFYMSAIKLTVANKYNTNYFFKFVNAWNKCVERFSFVQTGRKYQLPFCEALERLRY